MPTKRSVKRHLVIQPLDASYRLIPLTQKQNAIVDAVDFDWLSQWNWRAHWNEESRLFYVERSGSIRMHKQIVECNEDEDVDHINRNPLDNRRDNLRKCTKVQNQWNKKSKNKHGFKGVKFVSRHKLRPWTARIRHNGKIVDLGLFTSVEEAARAYDAAAIVMHGEFAYLNFPASPERNDPVNSSSDFL